MSSPGILHAYKPGQVAFELSPTSLSKVVIFIGGLSNGLFGVSYIHNVAKELGPLGWSVLQIQMTSSGKGWGLSSLDKDIEELKALVDYLRSPSGGARDKILLFGHSTGSQDTIHFLLNHGSSVEGGIMQGPVSDREGFGQFVEKQKWDRLNAKAKELVDNGHKNDILPTEYAEVMDNTAITAYRWCSLTLPGGDDDYFSSDLSEEHFKTTFGRIQKPFLMAYSEFDQFVPEFVNKPQLLQKWATSSNPMYYSKHSGIIKGASHEVAQEDSRSHLCEMVKNFLKEFDL
ncbi:LAFA_0B06018g1_1 [Lachancea sp. 'fantastica']|nr:LAFA_0B06018g1_1 [Lachancea sp. 'fantastica']